MEKTIGILGGMGPEATAYLFRRIIWNTKADKDQEHLKVIIFNNPKIPDRTEYILKKGENPLPHLIHTAKELERFGADFILIPCNTAHYFFDDISGAVSIPVINMIEAVADEVLLGGEGEHRAGLLCTPGTLKAGIYDKVFSKKGIDIIIPLKNEQEKVTQSIYNVKKGMRKEVGKNLLSVCNSLLDRGASSIVLGCTELSVAFEYIHHEFKVFDSTGILARKAVETASSDGDRPNRTY